ncbi:sulfotransferase family 2 domain-containing protein [Vreelandella titanicae]|uniref:sulfotransferase family 2 domain-containing protein n=1 Tax=Vreelandella titanicae TaxID=664683 RepID=UPI00137585B4
MISHKHKCIFAHIRKAGGFSVRHMLGETNHILSDGTMSPDWNELINHKHNDYFKSFFIRHPWNRFISCWKYCWSTNYQTIK